MRLLLPNSRSGTAVLPDRVETMNPQQDQMKLAATYASVLIRMSRKLCMTIWMNGGKYTMKGKTTVVLGILILSSITFAKVDTKSLIADLGQSVDVSQRAHSTLVALGKNAVDALAQGLTSWDPLIRYRCATAMAEIGSPALPALKQALKNPEWRIRVAALTALDDMNTYDATNLIVAASTDDYWFVRSQAVGALRDTTDPAGLAVLNDLSANDMDPRVRERASGNLLALSRPRP